MTALLPSEVLAKAADLIEPEAAWTQGYYARNAEDEYVEPEAPDAICWCAIGAMGHVMGRDPTASDPVFHAERFLMQAFGGLAIVNWNDAPERTQAEVVAALRKAAELAREAGQ